MLTNEQYLEAISHKFDLQDYPALILDKNSEVLFVNKAYARLYESQTKEELEAYGDDGTSRLLHVSHAFKEKNRHIILQNRPMHFVETIIANGKKHMFFTRKLALVAPSGDVLGVEMHMISFEVLLGTLCSWSFIGPFIKDDISLASTLKPFEITDTQETYIFFILKGFTNKEIAEVFDVSVRTVENNYRGLLKKLRAYSSEEITNRSDFKREAFRLGYGSSMPRALVSPSSIPVDGIHVEWSLMGKTKAS